MIAQMSAQNSTDPICVVSGVDAVGDAAIEAVVASDQMFYIMPIFVQAHVKDTVTVEGKEWYQPDLFTELSWNEINAVCPEGKCVGMLNDYDMTGWTWATIKDMNDLFNYYIGSNVLGPGPDRVLLGDSEAVTAFYNDGWRSSFSGMEDLEDWGVTQGWVSNSKNRPWVTRCCMYDDMMATKPENVLAHGAWFYRNL
jgi:hypothetical protein